VDAANRVAFRVDENDAFVYFIAWDDRSGNVYHVEGYGDDRSQAEKPPLDIRSEIGRKSPGPDGSREAAHLFDLPLFQSGRGSL